MHASRLFTASCVALIATAMSFAIRGDIMPELQQVYGLNDTQLGWIGTAAFWGFGLSILFGGPLCDLLGMGTIMRLAAAGHIGGTILTILAPNFATLFLATVLIGTANGFVEAAINPLVATIYANEKTKKLTMLHAWFPGGIVIGGLAAFLFTQLGLHWQAKMLLLLIPSAIYTFLFVGHRFPPTERAAAGVPASDMVRELTKPLFIVIWLSMWLTAATELGPGTWIPTIFNRLIPTAAQAGIVNLVWINLLMYLLRQFAGGISHKVSPVGLIAGTSLVAAAGLYMFSQAHTATAAFIAATVFGAGIAFWWPTMLGITSERFPRGGALALAVIGASGSFATAISGPIMGRISDYYGVTQANPELAGKVLAVWALLPVALFVIFGLIYLADRAKGGYRVEQIQRGGARA
jgi:MFS family permease